MRNEKIIWAGLLFLVGVYVIKTNKLYGLNGLGCGECDKKLGCLGCSYNENGLGNLGYELAPVFDTGFSFNPIKQIVPGSITNFGKTIIKAMKLHDDPLNKIIKLKINKEKSNKGKFDKFDRVSNIPSFSDVPLVPYSVSLPITGYTNDPIVGGSRIPTVIVNDAPIFFSGSYSASPAVIGSSRVPTIIRS